MKMEWADKACNDECKCGCRMPSQEQIRDFLESSRGIELNGTGDGSAGGSRAKASSGAAWFEPTSRR